LRFTYGLDDKLPAGVFLLLGLQWLAVAVPPLVIIGKVVAQTAFAEDAARINYLQKLALVSGMAMLVQLRWGHRLPLVMGPAAVLLVGVVSAGSASTGAVYSAIAAGGLLLAFIGMTGLLKHLQRLFTPRVVAAVLLLIAFTLMPAVQKLLLAPGSKPPPLANLAFGGLLVLVLFLGQRLLRGLWRSILIALGMIGGSLVYLAWAGPVRVPEGQPVGFFSGLVWPPQFDAGVFLAFLFCVLALAVNDVGSIQSMQGLLNPSDMEGRLQRGVTLTGGFNLCAGLLGVLGPVNFSLSPGVVTASGCAARQALLPAGLGLVLLAFSPAALAWIGAVPQPVVGAVLLYILCAQVAAGMLILFEGEAAFEFRHGLTVGLSVLLGTVIAFLPPEVVNAFPVVLRPVLGNGFVVGTVAVLVLEHGIFRFSNRA